MIHNTLVVWTKKYFPKGWLILILGSACPKVFKEEAPLKVDFVSSVRKESIMYGGNSTNKSISVPTTYLGDE